MSNTAYIATSIDGFIARENGDIDWLTGLPNPTNSDYGFSAFLARMDGIIMGRKTFETVLKFSEWPYAATMPLFVLSNTLTTVPAHVPPTVQIVKGALKDILQQLNAKGINNLYVDGGKTIQSFLKEDLIDELIITRVPVLLGAGIPLFGSSAELKYEHVATDVPDNILVRSRYIRKR